MIGKRSCFSLWMIWKRSSEDPKATLSNCCLRLFTRKPASTADSLFLLLEQVFGHSSGLVLKKISMTLLFAVKDSSLSAAFFPVMVFLFYWNGLSKETVGMNKGLLKDVFSGYSLQSPFLLCLVYSFLLSPFLPPRRVYKLIAFL